MSRTLSMNCGSGESLNASLWWGLSPKARQMRLIAVWLIPVAAAIERVDQWVAFGGCSSSVLPITRSSGAEPSARAPPAPHRSARPLPAAARPPPIVVDDDDRLRRRRPRAYELTTQVTSGPAPAG